MGCIFDEYPIGIRFTHRPGSSTYCGECNEYWPMDYRRGTYIGHYEYPSGRYAIIKLDEPFICPGCGLKSDVIKVDCDSTDLFEKAKVEKNEDVEAISRQTIPSSSPNNSGR